MAVLQQMRICDVLKKMLRIIEKQRKRLIKKQKKKELNKKRQNTIRYEWKDYKEERFHHDTLPCKGIGPGGRAKAL